MFERQPIQRSLISAANNRQVGPTHMKEPSKHATKAAEEAASTLHTLYLTLPGRFSAAFLKAVYKINLPGSSLAIISTMLLLLGSELPVG